MEKIVEPCNVCGGTDLKLLDGFYFCSECGTQDENVRETVLEDKALEGGTYAHTVKKRIVIEKSDGIEMSGEWYKWHAFNFIISGLADELITLGAKPTFKDKLLWIWIRYVKKYQNKEELLMNKTHGEQNSQILNTFLVEEDSNAGESSSNQFEEGNHKSNFAQIKDNSKRDIHFLSKGLIIAMLYVALNLDENDIQLSHLYRFLQENKLNMANLNRFIPEDINVKKVPTWINFSRSKLINQHLIRSLAMSLLRKLNLGPPKVPDLKKITDNFVTELCLPSDIKPFVYSLMHLCKINFLDVDNKYKNCLVRFPDYECSVMTYILITIKILFGLDCTYETKLSDIVDTFNVERDLPKSYSMYGSNSDRLFSFREWCSYLNFRKFVLSKYNLKIAEKCGLEIDDFIYFEQIEERISKNVELSDKISMEIVDKLPKDNPLGVIPKEMFLPTLTPMSEYTNVISAYCQHPEIKEKLTEDFKSYSLKYACEDLNLIDSNLENVIKGVSEDNKIKNKMIQAITIKKAKTEMVYVKSCDNKNWMKTNPPTMEHVCLETDVNDKASDHGYDSENTSKDKDIESENNITSTSTSDVHVDNDAIPCNDTNEKNEINMIQEEEEGKNIFDDSFEDIDLKEEQERNHAHVTEIQTNDNQDDNQIDPVNDDFDCRSNISSDSDAFMPTFNPDTFDRDRTIKELVLIACKKYKIPTPTEYKVREPRKRKEKAIDGEPLPKRQRKAQHNGPAARDILSDYYKYQESDFVNVVRQQMSLADIATDLQDQSYEVPQNLEDATEVNATTEDVLDSYDNHNETESMVGVNENNDFNTTNKTENYDPTLENTLFEDEEMNLTDLVEKGDPKYDENKYEIDQLYIKIKNEPEDLLLKRIQQPDIHEILDKEIEECSTNLKVDVNNAKPKIKEKIKVREDSDSEDDIPLSDVKENIRLAEELFAVEAGYEPLIKKNVSEYNYWIRHYSKDFMLRSKDSHTRFDEELKENTPASFYFVIQQCSSILNCSNFHLYKSMQNLEQIIISKAKNSKNGNSSLLEHSFASPE